MKTERAEIPNGEKALSRSSIAPAVGEKRPGQAERSTQTVLENSQGPAEFTRLEIAS
jgi:hypothetical protein